MYKKLLVLSALVLISVVGFRVTGVQASPLTNPRRSSYWDPSRFVPLSHVMPGGQGVNYLSDLTKNLADDMSSRIALGSQVVSAVGQTIEHQQDATSDAIQHVSDIVDSNYKPTRDHDEDEEEMNEAADDFGEIEPRY